MAAMLAFRRSHFLLRNAYSAVILSSRSGMNLPPDQLPGPYPRTAAEWQKAARKYGIPIEEYTPYPDDGYGWGDYPQIPIVHRDARNKYRDWDHDGMFLNWGDPVHVDEDILLETRPDIFTEHRHTKLQMCMYFFGFLGTFTFLWYIGLYMPCHSNCSAKIYPHGYEPDFRTYNPTLAKEIHYGFPPS